MNGNGLASKVLARQNGLRLFTAKCVGAGAADPASLEGDAVTCTRTGTGDYVFTIRGSGPLDIRNVDLFVKQAASKDLVVQADYDETARTITATVKNAAGSFAEIDLTSSEELLLTVTAKTLKN